MPATEPNSTPESLEIRRLRAEHDAAMQALQSAIRDTTRLTRLFAILSEAGELGALLDRVLATVSELFMSDVVALLEATPGGCTPMASIGLPADTRQQEIPAAAGGRTLAALVGGDPGVTMADEAGAAMDEYLRVLGVKAVAWQPVAGDRALRRGVLVVGRCRPVPFERADVDLLAAMAYRIGQMIDRARDEEERRRLETKLRQAEKAESLGRMAGAIAHLFNNMLAVVVGRLDLAMVDLPADGVLRDDIERARDAAKRAAETSGLMLAYLGQSVTNREPVDLAVMLRETVDAMRATFRPDVTVETRVDAVDTIVSASAPQLAQLVRNLLANASEAIGDRPGLIRVALGMVAADKMPPAQSPLADWRPTAERYACLEIEDTGCGMMPATIEKIFDPFFTTKFTGRGLGLAVVLGTVRGHDGLIAVQSAPGKGTKFRVHLPALACPAQHPAKVEVKTRPVTRHDGVVLVAEDEDIVRRTTVRALSKLGHEVVATEDGMAAVNLFRARGDVRLVLLDLTMPRLDGWGALDAMRETRPDVPVILASGYDEARARGSRPVDHSVVFLHKPYTLVELAAAVEKADAISDQTDANLETDLAGVG
ncbi:MAG TPA: ATP-binding protein [Opitutus sp.]|nr:ATP-binding protein [Opitutus sp.]